jgi:alkanesulfonate monooxygenase SsuD/methylene tetrahydromethanopterin reductase-like flavin-dependent oxidoreductase (luciferase family)
MVGTPLTCDAVEGRFLQAADVPALLEACWAAHTAGAEAVILADSPLGDAVTLAAALGTSIRRSAPDLLLGVQADLSLSAADLRRHPTVLARDITALDQVWGGKTALVLTGPLDDDAVLEAARLCHAMWRQGIAQSDGPQYPVPDAVNRPAPLTQDSPVIVLDLTNGDTAPPSELLELADFVLRPADGSDACTVEAV